MAEARAKYFGEDRYMFLVVGYSLGEPGLMLAMGEEMH